MHKFSWVAKLAKQLNLICWKKSLITSNTLLKLLSTFTLTIFVTINRYHKYNYTSIWYLLCYAKLSEAPRTNFHNIAFLCRHSWVHFLYKRVFYCWIYFCSGQYRCGVVKVRWLSFLWTNKYKNYWSVTTLYNSCKFSSSKTFFYILKKGKTLCFSFMLAKT